MMERLIFCAVFLAATLTGTTALPTPLPAGNSEAPLEISADGTLEWLRSERQYVARGRARAQQGAFALNAETLRALYEEGADGTTRITKILGEDAVTIDLPPQQAQGSHLEYDVVTGVAVLTGTGLRMTSPGESTEKPKTIITAQKEIRYHATQQKLVALGAARAQQGSDSLEADTLTAFLEKKSDGKTALKTLKASGNVVITTRGDRVTGDSGNYTPATGQAELLGNVRILRGQDVLQGGRALVDLSTGKSQLFADSPDAGNAGERQEGGRVTGVFYPKKSSVSTPSAEETSPPQEAPVPTPEGENSIDTQIR